MKRLLPLLGLLLFLTGCSGREERAKIAATTLPVYEFTAALCQGTDLTVTQVVTENVSCLHDYSLSVRQTRAIEGAEVVVLSGGGLEDFLNPLLSDKTVISAGSGLELRDCGHGHEGHDHGADAHFWLSPAYARAMAENICQGLCRQYPQYETLFAENLAVLTEKIRAVEDYGKQTLSQLSCREMITFHDGFSYFAHAFDLEILEAVEEESGSEASASELKHLTGLVESHSLPAVFTEENGSVSAASILSRETGVKVYSLSMAMSGDSWFDAMYHNIDTVKEALG